MGGKYGGGNVDNGIYWMRFPYDIVTCVAGVVALSTHVSAPQLFNHQIAPASWLHELFRPSEDIDHV